MHSFNKAFAIESIISNSVDSSVTKEISFEHVICKAKEHSFDLKIAHSNNLQSIQDIRNAKSEYFPKIYFAAATEYTHNFNDPKFSIITNVGDSFINPYTRYQSIMGISLSYNIFDFGIRKRGLDIAFQDQKLKILEEQQIIQELYLNIIDTYTNILITSKEINSTQNILDIEMQNLDFKQRLFDAKQIPFNDLSSAKIRVQNLNNKLCTLKDNLCQYLLILSFYTGEQYSENSTIIHEFPRGNNVQLTDPDYTQSLIWKIFQIKIAKKQNELKIAKKLNFPKVSAYGRYYLYGADSSNFYDNLANIKPSNYSVGAAVNMPIFDGFKNLADIKKTELELHNIEIERDKAIAQFLLRIATLKSNLLYIDNKISLDAQNLIQLEKNLKMNSRLQDNKIITPIELNLAKIDLLQQKFLIEKNQLTKSAITKSLQVLIGNFKV